MSKVLYKYVGHSTLDKMFSGENHISLKCSYPKDFNDPYELFLTINFKESPEVLAFYQDVVGELPQLPTTCFSLSPSITPMWAHYAQDLQGFVVALSEKLLSAHFPKSGFGSVDYQDAPDDSIKDTLDRAFAIGKPRYLYMLQKSVFGSAYYTKSAYWAYEAERRMVVEPSETRSIGDLILIDVPNECIEAIIVGPRATETTVNALSAHAERVGCHYYRMRIGRSSTVPFFLDTNGTPYVCNDGVLAKCSSFCETCKEPVHDDAEQCSWCKIEESHERLAAERNTFRMLAARGVLGEYIAEMESITHGRKRK